MVERKEKNRHDKIEWDSEKDSNVKQTELSNGELLNRALVVKNCSSFGLFKFFNIKNCIIAKRQSHHLLPKLQTYDYF